MEQHIMLARQALDRGNGSRALEHLSHGADFDRADTWTITAVALEQCGRSEEAVRAARSGLAIDPDDRSLQLALSRSLVSLGDLEGAERAVLAVLNRHPEDVGALSEYAWVLSRAGDIDGAAMMVDRLERVRGGATVESIAMRGHVAILQGRTSEARRLLEQARQHAPDSVSVHQLLALEAAVRGRGDQAADHGLTAARLDPGSAADLGREARFFRHPLMAPVRFINRVGPAQLWIGWLVVLFGLPTVWPDAPMGWLTLAYLSLAAYSWTVPWLLRRWMTRQGSL